MDIIIHVVLWILFVGLLLGLFNKFAEIDKSLKNLINLIVLVAVVIWLFTKSGLLKGPLKL